MYEKVENKIYEAPVVTIDNFYNDEPVLIVHNYVNLKGKLVVNRIEAALLYAELHKFVFDKKLHKS